MTATGTDDPHHRVGFLSLIDPFLACLPIDLFVLRQVCVQDRLLVLLIHCGPMGTSYVSDSYVVHDGSKPSRRHSDHGR